MDPGDIDGAAPLIDGGGKVDPESLRTMQQALSGDDEPLRVRFQLRRDLAKRLDRYLVDRVPHLSRTSMQRLIAEHAVTVNGRDAKPSTRLRLGDVVEVILPPPPVSEIVPEQIPIAIIHEDTSLVVLDKQADLIVHPARGHQSGTLINGLAWHFKHGSADEPGTVGNDAARSGVVHRLDRHTSGVIVVAKTETAHWRLARQFETRKVAKRYLTVVHGELHPSTDVVDIPLGRHPVHRERYAVRWDGTGKDAISIYRVRERYRDFTLVEVEIRTGRTHQIRLHMAHLGHPVAGDDLYGGRRLSIGDIIPRTTPLEVTRTTPIIERQALHAAVLGFDHPDQDVRVTYEAPLPTDMRLLVGLLRAHALHEVPSVPGTLVDLESSMQESLDDA